MKKILFIITLMLSAVLPRSEAKAVDFLSSGYSIKTAHNTEGTYTAFEYDALGRRTAKINPRANTLTRFLWDSNTPLHQWTYPLDERPKLTEDEWGNYSYEKEEPQTELTTWVFDEGTFVPCAKLVGNRRYSIITHGFDLVTKTADGNINIIEVKTSQSGWRSKSNMSKWTDSNIGKISGNTNGRWGNMQDYQKNLMDSIEKAKSKGKLNNKLLQINIDKRSIRLQCK